MRILVEVLLVIVLGEVERRSRWTGDLGRDLAVSRLCQLLLVHASGSFGGGALRFVVDEYGRPVLVAAVVALAHALGGVVVLPEDLQELFVACLRWIEH